jgi:hypothetical protein
MVETVELPFSMGTFVTYQEMLLKMNAWNVDEVVVKFNEDSTWQDLCVIVQLVSTVAGSRKNGAELIEFMTKLSDIRGYSAVLRQVEEIEKLLESPSLEEEVTSVIVREQSNRDATNCEVRGFIESETLPVRAAVAELLPLMDAIVDPLAVRHPATGGGTGSVAVVAGGDNHARLREAVEEAALMKFSAEAVVAGAEAAGESAMAWSKASALNVVFEPLRVSLEAVKQRVEVARGFDALDGACAGAPCTSALELFALEWGLFRGTAVVREVDPLAAAIVAQDLTRVKELIGGYEAGKIVIDVEKLPLGLPGWPRKEVNLLEIASGVGGQVLRYLLEFHGLKPEPHRDFALEHAIAVGDPETIRMLWDRTAAEARVKWKWPIVSSVEFHRVEVERWLIAEHPPWLGLARRVAREKRALDVLSCLPEGDEELPPLFGLVEMYGKALEHFGVPLASLGPVFRSGKKPEEFDEWSRRIGHSLLLVEGEGGRAFGALIAIRWPKVGNTAKDVWRRSFLFTVDAPEPTRFLTVAPLVLFHDQEKLCVGELTLDLKKREYSVDSNSSCTDGRFPAVSGRVVKWEIRAV